MVNKILLYTLIVGIIILGSLNLSNAEQWVTLPNGQKINVENLSTQEIYDAIKIGQKSVPKESVGEFVKGINPNDLDAWRQLITGTIKDVCNDLSITVNEFVKTPVGLGIAALIVYKVAGKDILDNALDILIIVPLWFILTGIILYIAWYFYHCKTLYEYRDIGDGKIEKTNPKRVTAYAWEEDSENKSNLACTLIIAQIFITIVGVIIVLA